MDPQGAILDIYCHKWYNYQWCVDTANYESII